FWKRLVDTVAEQGEPLFRASHRAIRTWELTVSKSRQFALLAQNAEDPDHQHAVKYGMQTNEAVIVLTLRKFQDTWRWHIDGTVRAGSPAHAAAEWILREAEARKLRETANQLVAHFRAAPRGVAAVGGRDPRADPEQRLANGTGNAPLGPEGDAASDPASRRH